MKAFGSIRRLNVKALKSFAKQHKIDVSGAIEKAEIRSKIVRHLQLSFGEDRIAGVAEAVATAKAALEREAQELAAKERRKVEMARKAEERRKRIAAEREAEKSSYVKKLVRNNYKSVIQVSPFGSVWLCVPVALCGSGWLCVVVWLCGSNGQNGAIKENSQGLEGHGPPAFHCRSRTWRCDGRLPIGLLPNTAPEASQNRFQSQVMASTTFTLLVA